MSEQFIQRFLSFFFQSIILVLLVVGSTECFLFYTWTGAIAFYVVFGGILIFASVYGVVLYLSFRGFRESVAQGLFDLVQKDPESNGEPLDIETDDTALQVCAAYRNGQSFGQIAEHAGLKNRTEVMRQVRRGLEVLLKSYGKQREGAET